MQEWIPGSGRTYERKMLFGDQVKVLSNWFKNWNECEQTVALFSLLKRVQKRQAKFLLRCLEHGLKDCTELAPTEMNANDAGFIGRLQPQQEQVIDILLSHLPLLKPGNIDAKTRYLELLPKVLAFAVERSEHLQESRQLLSYSLIHPAFNNDERTSLTSWMEHLEDRLPSNESQNGETVDAKGKSDENHNKLWKDDPALPRPAENQTVSPSWQPIDNGPKIESSLASPIHRPDDSDQHQHNDTSKGSDEQAVAEYDFNPWLKTLRLHKYTELLNSMKYEEMLQLTEETLESKNVTKGARDKILLNVKKLHERFEKLRLLEKDIPGGGSLRNALNELKSMICTPIIRFEAQPESIVSPNDPTPAEAKDMAPSSTQLNKVQPGDIPGQFTKVMGKACTQLLISRPDKDNIALYMQVLERCMQHNAFTSQQKKRLSSWKQQINKIYRSLPRNQQMSSQRNAVGGNFPNKRVSGRSLPSFGAGARMASPVASPPLQASSPLSMYQAQALKPNWYGSGYGSNTHPSPHTTAQHSVEVARKTASLDPKLVQRPAAYPRTGEGGNAVMANHVSHGDTDISKRLDSLSLSVAEQALPD